MFTEYSQTVVSSVLSEVRRRYGISVTEVHTGGGSFALEGRLESGHWLVITDPDCWGLRDRARWEDENGIGLGWSVGIYPHGGDETDWFGQDSIADAFADDAYAADTDTLCDTIDTAMAALTAR